MVKRGFFGGVAELVTLLNCGFGGAPTVRVPADGPLSSFMLAETMLCGCDKTGPESDEKAE